MNRKTLGYFVFLIFGCYAFSQTLTGTIVDAVTKQPIETASVYFDNTTIGTTSNANGEFSISYTDAIQSNLIISFLGYGTQTIADYRQLKNITIALSPTNNLLDEVYINTNDGLTRKQKLKLFREQFLGASKNGKQCKILNEDALILRYHKKEKQLTASATEALKIVNKVLQYNITYNLETFEIQFSYVNEKKNSFAVYSTVYAGSNYFEDFINIKPRKAKKARDHTFKGSTLEFMRALYNKQLTENLYQIYYNRFPVPPYKYLDIQPLENTTFKTFKLLKPIQILYNKSQTSGLQILSTHVIIDPYGNYANPTDLMFSGALGYQRIGELLPLNYGLEE